MFRVRESQGGLSAQELNRNTSALGWYQATLELFFLPPYAPELNPDEYLNNDLKPHLSLRPKPGDKPSLVKQVRTTMQAFQRQPARTCSYFRALAVRYAA